MRSGLFGPLVNRPNTQSGAFKATAAGLLTTDFPAGTPYDFGLDSPYVFGIWVRDFVVFCIQR